MTSPHGEIIQESVEDDASQRPAPPTPLERERERRAQAQRAEARARWDAGVRREGLWAGMVTIRQRLAELPAVLEDLRRRQALAPRVVALAQDILDEALGPAWSRRVHDLHRAVMMETAFIGNAAAARKLLADIEAHEFGIFVANGIVHTAGENPNLFRTWRQQLSWHTAPLPEPSADACERRVEELEGAVLAEILARRKDERNRFGPRDATTGRFTTEDA